ncbi:hypothetical protein BC830DRAFT_1133802 [Chytriomyces sp. MP71]|nr:hypothetical protein BC830DRAFT_1133802 [Chytriomyces sp. MP71]
MCSSQEFQAFVRTIPLMKRMDGASQLKSVELPVGRSLSASSCPTPPSEFNAPYLFEISYSGSFRGPGGVSLLTTAPSPAIFDFPRYKAFRCPWQGCMKEYSEVRNLKAHYQMHTNANLHECKECKSNFVRHRDLMRHNNSVHAGTAKSEFRCESCGLLFSRRDSLLRHAKIHTRLVKDLL